MPFERPTFTQLRRQNADDINAEVDGVDARLRFSNVGIIADVQARAEHEQFGYIDWIARQSCPFTATGEYLEGWAAFKGVFRKPATFATGQVTFAATNGKIVPAGTPVSRSDGMLYTVVTDATAAGGNVAVTVVANMAGASPNADVATTMFLTGGISGVNGTGAVTTSVSGGADVENDDALRTRMLTQYAAPPQGGSITDYPNWAAEVPGVTRAWLKRNAMGPGTLAILFMMDEAQAANDGFPQGTDGGATWESRATAATGDQLTVANYIFPRQNVLATVYAVAPTPNELTITIAGLSGASAGLKTAIATAIASALRYSGAPGGITSLLKIESAIAAVNGSDGAVITAIACSAGSIVGGGSVGNVQSNEGALPKLTSVVYV